MTNYLKLAIFPFFFFLCFCSKPENDPSQHTNELTFEVDASKLEPLTRIENLGIQFSSPQDWKPIEENLFGALSKKVTALNVSDSAFLCQPISIFLNTEDKSTMFISIIQGLSDTTALARYKNFLHENLSPRKTGDFLKDQIHFSQFLIQDDQHINFKLIFENLEHQFIQFDYIIPINNYVSELKAIEASIGSINLINQE